MVSTKGISSTTNKSRNTYIVQNTVVAGSPREDESSVEPKHSDKEVDTCCYQVLTPPEWKARLLRAMSQRQSPRGSTSRCFYHPAPLTRATRRSRGFIEDQHASTTSQSEFHGSPEALSSSGSRSDHLLSAGYLGPTSFVSVLGEGDGANELVTAADESSAASSVPAWWVKRATEIVGHLVEFPTLKQLILEFYGVSQAAVIAAPFVLNALSQMQDTYHAYQLDQGETEIPALVATVLDNTRRKFSVPPTVDGVHFHRLYTGSCLRLEILGVVYALAGRASQFGLGRPKNKLLSSRFARRMLAASDTALETCKYLSPVNDLTLWLLHENLLLSTLVLGHSNFLLESRRRLFAAVYQLDKSIATFLGRPPRISWRHSDCRLPLDISDEALTGSRALAQRSVTAEGWSCHAVYQRSAWIRLRFLISTFREEILELSLTNSSENRDGQLSVKVMLIVSYLAFLYNEFLVQRLLALNNTEYSAALVDLLLYGFPSASVLLRALQLHASTNQLPNLYPRGILIRHLSVFISHLESMAGPGTANNAFFSRATRVFSRIMDEILAPEAVTTTETSAVNSVDDLDVSMFSDFEGVGLLDTMDFASVLDQVLY
ncbi:transcription factor domain-containing protein [Aspergillus novofumigatus IBT 16806]|uniref:Xylanolytic transcriptional activator regulatory domain-containing protein n=1 Tax=Aspergillus novofumigatus (strain IBT 16806) TaxID=1392255 RepID=A0A2I1C8H0_ASPN1|nr:uncharacterized protein P174DRAFT_430860 [Aspergillus novofumigatus IBT 16806]PKX93881.1 hypothetical protein P174DRAFT_430860 [Aspergillus novofumigatus IBT 16806]